MHLWARLGCEGKNDILGMVNGEFEEVELEYNNHISHKIIFQMINWEKPF